MVKSLAEKKKLMAQMIGKVNDKIGKSVIGFASDPLIKEKMTIKWIATPSLRVNEMTGGGFPIGKISIVTGLEDSGKTSFLLETIGKNMKMDPDFMALWLESEESFTTDMIELFNIDPERIVVIHLDKDGAAEVALDRLEAMLTSGAFNIAVINSLKCLTPSTEMESNMGQQTIGLQARLFGKLMRKVVTLISENECALIMVNHLSTNIGTMYGDPLVMTGGKAIAYASLLTLDFRKKSVLDSDPVSKEECMKIGVSVKKNHCKINRMPYLKTDYFVKYGYGIDSSVEIIDLAEKLGIITKKGAWYREYTNETDNKGNPIERILPDGTKAAWNGLKAIRAYIANNQDYFNFLSNKISNYGKIDVEEMSAEEIAKIEQEQQEELQAAKEIGLELEDVLEAPDKKKKK